MKTKRFDFNFKPLQINVSFVCEGGVPDTQNYDADTDTYTPDYTLVNLIIQPRVGRIDKDEVLTAGEVNKDLANVRWEQTVNGKRVEITDSTAENPPFKIVRSGNNAGRITICKNAIPQVPLNLVFSCDYADPRTGQVYHIERTKQVQCKNTTTYTPLLVLDAAAQTIYNPLSDQDTQTVHASLRLGANECPENKRLFVWEVMREDGTFTAVGSDTTLDYDVVVAEDGNSCTVNRSLMGTELYLRCRAKYSPNGNPSGVTLSDNAPTKLVAFIRRIPKFEYDIGELPTNIPSGLLEIAPTAKIWNTNGMIDNPERELLPLWYVATNAQSGTLNYSLIAHGMAPTLSTKKVSQTLGGVYGLDVKDVGPACAWEDSDGAVFVDADDNVILIK